MTLASSWKYCVPIALLCFMNIEGQCQTLF